MNQVNPKTVAIVVTHNRLTQLQRTVQSVLDPAEGPLHALIIVDNASSDGTAEWLASQRDSRLHVEVLRENRGGAGQWSV